MASRIIMRIELSSGAKQEFEDTPTVLGMTQIAVTSKLFRWFARQDEELQLSILGVYPLSAGQDITAKVLKRIISDVKKPDRRKD